jgi:hypothetical protein
VQARSRYARHVSSLPLRTPTSLRFSACALCVLALLALAGTPAWAAGAKSLGGGGALGNLTKGASETKPSTTATKPPATPTTVTTTPTATTPTTETSTKESEPHNSRSVILVIAGAAVLLLSGVAFVIVRDARKMAPTSEVEFAEGSTPRHSEAALRKRRAKAKAARQQRKRNR